MEFVRRAVREKSYRLDTRAKDWIGHLVAQRLGLDPSNTADRQDIKEFLRACLKRGIFAVESRTDAKCKERQFVVPTVTTADRPKRSHEAEGAGRDDLEVAPDIAPVS